MKIEGKVVAWVLIVFFTHSNVGTKLKLELTGKVYEITSSVVVLTGPISTGAAARAIPWAACPSLGGREKE